MMGIGNLNSIARQIARELRSGNKVDSIEPYAADTKNLPTLTLNLKGKYFDEILAGRKVFEYRLVNAYWQKRMLKKYQRLVLRRGYPKGGGVEGETRMTMFFAFASIVTITHDEFGREPVTVYAISADYSRQKVNR